MFNNIPQLPQTNIWENGTSLTEISRQSDLTQEHVDVAHRQFSRICQVAPMCTPSNTWFRGLTRLSISNGMSISSVILQGSRSWQTDQPTDHATPVCNNRPHLRGTETWPRDEGGVDGADLVELAEGFWQPLTLASQMPFTMLLPVDVITLTSSELHPHDTPTNITLWWSPINLQELHIDRQTDRQMRDCKTARTAIQ